MEIKLIACDMDDTLLNSKREVSPRNLAAIQAALAAGKVFLLATGRMYASVKPFAEKLGLGDVPLVTFNGALVKGSESGKVFYEHRLKLETANDVLAYIKEHHYYAQTYTGNSFYVDKITDCSRMYSGFIGIPATPLGEAFYHMEEPPYKMLAMRTGDIDFETMWTEFAETFKGRLDVTSSKPDFLELMEPGVNKWEAVKAVGASMGIKPEEIMCIGDSNNDLQMVANAGIGVAVANANDNIKDLAKIVTASNDNDGVALVIESILTKQAEE